MAKRIFVYGDKEYEDHDPSMSKEEVRAQFAGYFPELANASIETKVMPDGTERVVFAKKAGTKGAFSSIPSDEEFLLLQTRVEHVQRAGDTHIDLHTDVVLGLMMQAQAYRSILKANAMGALVAILQDYFKDHDAGLETGEVYSGMYPAHIWKAIEALDSIAGPGAARRVCVQVQAPELAPAGEGR